jgi:DNA invertase Pin-like site-specific DNA recombinase
MLSAQILDDIRRWPRDRMVGAPASPPRVRRPRSYTLRTNTERRAAVARVEAGESVAVVAYAVGVSRMTLYTWRSRGKHREAVDD